MAILSRADWNDIIQRVNALAIDCDVNAPPLEEVESNHIWAKSDIREVQGRLRQICNENEFTDPIPDFWEQSIIDEIEVAIAFGCCVGNCWLITFTVEAGYELNLGAFTTVVDGVDLPLSGFGYVVADDEAGALAQLNDVITQFYTDIGVIGIVSHSGTITSFAATLEATSENCS